MNFISRADRAVIHFIDKHLACRFMDKFMPAMTMLGDLGIVWMITAIFLIPMRRYRIYGISMIVIVLVSAFLGDIVIKPLVRRMRPFVKNKTIRLIIRNPGGYSFPSGHTSSSVGAAYVLLQMNLWVGIAGIIVAGLIAFSRVYLHVHYPTDIFAGAVLGLICGILILSFIFHLSFLSVIPMAG